MHRGDEEPFFTVLFNDDLWKELKKYMFPGQKVANFYDYKDGDTAITYEYVGLVKESTNLSFTFVSMNYACELLSLDLVKYLYREKNIEITEMGIKHACVGDAVDLVMFLCETSPNSYVPEAGNLAAGNGCLQVVKILHENHKEFTVNAVNYAAESGHLDVIKFFHEKGYNLITPEIIDIATENGHVKIVEWLYTNILGIY